MHRASARSGDTTHWCTIRIIVASWLIRALWARGAVSLAFLQLIGVTDDLLMTLAAALFCSHCQLRILWVRSTENRYQAEFIGYLLHRFTL
jgi:hypothetical protein